MKFPLTRRARLDDCSEKLRAARESRDKYKERSRWLETIVDNTLQTMSPEESFAKKTLARNDLCYFGLRGCMRSGTNWLDSLLSRHPEIECYGEFHLQRLVEPWKEGFSFIEKRHFNLLPTTDFLSHPYEPAFKVAMARQIRNREATRLIGDRTPHSIEPLTIRDAKYISVVRDGRDVLVSMAFHFLNVNDDELRNAHGWTVEERFPRLASHRIAFDADRDYFKTHPDRLLEDEEFILHGANLWSEVVISDHQSQASLGVDQVRIVRYEDIHRNPIGITRELFLFLGTDPDLAPPLEGPLTPGFNESPGSFYRHGRVGDWQTYFTDDQSARFRGVAAETLALYGYE